MQNTSNLSVFQLLRQSTSLRDRKLENKELNITLKERTNSTENNQKRKNNKKNQSSEKIDVSSKNIPLFQKKEKSRKISIDSTIHEKLRKESINTKKNEKNEKMRKNSIDSTKNEKIERIRKVSIDLLLTRKGSFDMNNDLSINRIKMIKSTQKYNESDSESELDKEETIEVDEERKRKFSIDSWTEKEKELKKKINKKKQKIIDLVKKNKIICEGDDTIHPVDNFTKLIRKYNIDDNLVQTMKLSGFLKPTPVQMIAIPAFFKKRNIIALAPTGSGKTAAYGIPLITMLELHKSVGLRGIILSPTFDLASQISRELIFLNHRIPNHIEVKLLNKLNLNPVVFKEQIQSVDLLVTTPLKFLKLIKSTKLDLSTVEFLVLDEADRYFELGLTSQIKQILELFRNQKTCISLFSATIQHSIDELMNNFLLDPIKLIIGGKNNVLKTIKQKLIYCGNEYGKKIEVKNMIGRGEMIPPILIFVQSKERAIDLFDELRSEELKIECIHADKQKPIREEIINNFRTGKIWILICTELLGRGIDFKNINLVINYDFPNTVINYIHRVGRTGRAGKSGNAVTFFTDEDRPLLRSLGNMLKISGCEVPEWVLKIPKIDRKTKKKLAKFPVKRETISSKIEKNADRSFQRELKIRDLIHFKRLKKQEIMEQKSKGKQNENEEQFEEEEIE